MGQWKTLFIVFLLLFALILGGCARSKPPTATIESPQNGAVLSSKVVEFKGQGQGKEPLTYSWDFGDERGKSTEQNPTYTYEKSGTYTVALTVAAAKKAKAEAKITITVKDAPPVAKVFAYPTTGDAPLNVRFSSAGTTDPDDPATSLKFSWDFGDGVGKNTEPKPTYTYEKPGNFTVTLAVTDGDGMMATTTITIVVKEAAPSP